MTQKQLDRAIESDLSGGARRAGIDRVDLGPLAAVFAAFFVAFVGGCGGAEENKKDAAKLSAAAADQQQEIEYTRRCYSRSAEQAQAVKSGRYVPPQLYLHRWRSSDPGAKAGTSVKETVFAQAVAKGKSKHAMVVARGGAGKTSLAKALEVQLCGELRTFLVHLHWDVAVAEHPAGGPNPILIEMAKQLGAPKGGGALAFLKPRIGKIRPWLVLLDAFDEVSIDKRPAIVGWINALAAALPGLRTVVFSRPPVFDRTFGLTGIDVIGEIPPLSCQVVDRGIMGGPGGAAAGQRFRQFLKDFRLDTAIRSGKSCFYPHMSTWRDLGALRHIAKMRDSPALAKRLANQGVQTRSSVYEAYLVTLLQDDVQGTTMSPHDTLAMVDKIVDRVARPASRALSVRISDCEAIAKATASSPRGVCETLLQSSLFRRTRKRTVYRLANQTLADLFLARRVHARLPPAGGAGCDVLRDKAALFQSSEIGGFLLGMPRGRECLADVTGVICSRSVKHGEQLGEITRGLSAGSAGYGQIRDAVARAKQDARIPRCALKILDKLERKLRPKTGHITGTSH